MRAIAALLALFAANSAWAGETAAIGLPLEFLLFGLTLLGVALFHSHTLLVALAGLALITGYKLGFAGFTAGPGLSGLLGHLGHEWVTLVNLLCLLTGFAILSRHFEKSHLPNVLPRYLPHDWKGGFALLVLVFVMSGFLDNIAAAMIGGAMAHQVFKAKVHLAYLAAIVAAANAGGAGSVVGDTTTTMMWIAGIGPAQVVEAYLAATVALMFFGIPAAKAQHAHSPMLKRSPQHSHIDWMRVAIVVLILACAIATNVFINLRFPEEADHFPFLGMAVWGAILASLGLRRPDWEVLPETFKGSAFLLALVLCASMMPVESLPAASAMTTLGLGFVSAVFDNIPLTALAIRQGGYDWGFLAYAVGFGGSMLWFGSSAGVALANMYPEAKSVSAWLRHGWCVVLGYVAGFLVLHFLVGWQPATAVL